MGYQNLCTEFYNRTKPEASDAEVNFYVEKLKVAHKPILEAMCGSGRLLIPLLKKGLVIEGVDNSIPMLNSCRARCAQNGFTPLLYNQPLEQVSLEKQYGAIFIAVGSFQLICDRQQALQTLQRLHEHLMPGGFLLIDFFTPMDFLALEEEGFTTERQAINPDGSRIDLTTDFVMHKEEQYFTIHSTYQKIVAGSAVQIEEEDLALRWYSNDQIIQLLREAGFNNVIVHEVFFDPHEKSTVAQAYR